MYHSGRATPSPPLSNQATLLHRRLDKAGKKRMRVERLRLQLWMKLHPHEPGMVRPLDDLRQRPVRAHSAEQEPSRLKRRLVVDVDLIPVAVSLADPVRPVDGMDDAVAGQPCLVSAQPHRPAHVAIGLAALLEAFGAHPFGDQPHHRLLRLAEFGAGRALDSGDVPSRLDAGHLHAQADSEEGDLALPRELDAGDLALAAAFAEAAGDQDPVQGLELGGDVGFGVLEELGVEPFDPDLDPVGHAAVDEGFGQALVGVLEADIFADDPDRDLAFPVEQAVDDVVPAGHSRLGRIGDPEGAEDLGVEPSGVILGGDGVDALRVQSRDDRFLADVAEERDLGPVAVGERVLGAADEDLGLDSEAGQLAHRMLGRLGLQLAGGGDVGDEGGVDAERVLAPARFVDLLVPELADRLDEGERFDVADGAADLADQEIQVRLEVGGDELLDRVGDVGDDLDGGAEIVAPALAGDDALVDPARGDVVGLAGGDSGEALVMAEVEIGLGAVVGDVDLAMLVGRHRPGIDVEIGVELADPHLVAARLEERGERGGHQPLAKR